MLSGRSLAIAVLAWAFVRTTWMRMTGAVTGLRLFRANYAADRLPPLSAMDRAALARFSGCVMCGRCNEVVALKSGSLMSHVVAGSRSMPDFDVAKLDWQAVPEEALQRAEQICPGRVPLRELRSFVIAKSGRGLSLIAGDA